MAKPYGGKFSPGAVTAGDLQQRPLVDPVGARANLMLVPPVILLFTSLGSGPAGLATGIAGAAALGIGAWLLRDGLRAAAEWQARSVARRPALPRKIIAALLTGLGVGLATTTGDSGLTVSSPPPRIWPPLALIRWGTSAWLASTVFNRTASPAWSKRPRRT
jgi:hypothetical protein